MSSPYCICGHPRLLLLVHGPPHVYNVIPSFIRVSFIVFDPFPFLAYYFLCYILFSGNVSYAFVWYPILQYDFQHSSLYIQQCFASIYMSLRKYPSLCTICPYWYYRCMKYFSFLYIERCFYFWMLLLMFQKLPNLVEFCSPPQLFSCLFLRYSMFSDRMIISPAYIRWFNRSSFIITPIRFQTRFLEASWSAFVNSFVDSVSLLSNFFLYCHWGISLTYRVRILKFCSALDKTVYKSKF